MKTSTHSKTEHGTDSDPMHNFMHHISRLNESSFVQNTYVYLNHLTFPARIASIGYSLWEWTKRKYTNSENPEGEIVKEEEQQKEEGEEQKEEKEEQMEEEPKEESNTQLQMEFRYDLNDIGDPRRETRTIEKLIEEETKEALIQEQQEAWILMLVGKHF